MSYDVADRSAERQIYQRFVVPNEETSIKFDVSVPKSDIPALQFSYRLDGDSGKRTMIDATNISSYRTTNDSTWFKLELSSQIFSDNPGPYVLIIVSRFTTGDEISYDYPFEIKFE